MCARKARCKPLIHVIQSSNTSLIFTQELAFFRDEGGFPFRKQLRNFFEALYHTLVQGVRTFPPKVSDFIRPWRTPVALLGQHFDRIRYFESPFVACRWWYLLVDRDLFFLRRSRILIPRPSLFPQTRSPLQCFQTFANHLGHVFQDLDILYLGRSGSLFNISRNFANTLPGTVLNCWLIARATSYYY